jgi:hypothetical protein
MGGIENADPCESGTNRQTTWTRNHRGFCALPQGGGDRNNNRHLPGGHRVSLLRFGGPSVLHLSRYFFEHGERDRMTAHSLIFRDIAMVLAAALLCGLLAWRLRQPILLGYVLAGLLLSPLTPDWVGCRNRCSARLALDPGDRRRLRRFRGQHHGSDASFDGPRRACFRCRSRNDLPHARGRAGGRDSYRGSTGPYSLPC